MSAVDSEELAAFLREVRSLLEQAKEPPQSRPRPMCFKYPDAAKEIGIGLTKLKELVRDKKIKISTIGDTAMISRTEIDRICAPDEERPKVERRQKRDAWVPLKKGREKKPPP